MTIDSRLAELAIRAARTGDHRASAWRRRLVRSVAKAGSSSGELIVATPGVLASPSAPDTFERRLLAAVLPPAQPRSRRTKPRRICGRLPIVGAARLEVTTVIERRPRVDGVTHHRSGLLIDPDVTIIDAHSGLDAGAHDRRSVVSPWRCASSGAVDRRGAPSSNHDAQPDSLDGRAAPEGARPKPEQARAKCSPSGLLAARSTRALLEDFVFDALRRFAIPLPVAQFRVVVNGRERRIDLAIRRRSRARGERLRVSRPT